MTSADIRGPVSIGIIIVFFSVLLKKIEIQVKKFMESLKEMKKKKEDGKKLNE